MSNVQAVAGVPATPRSLLTRLSDMLVCPGQVFEEVVQTPARFTNWAVPLLLVWLSALLLSTAVYRGLPEDGTNRASATGAGLRSEGGAAAQFGKGSVATATCAAAVAGTLWSAVVIWCLGRFPLKVRFSFGKALEVVGLSQVVLVLGAVTTWLLILASGDSGARPALSFFVRGLPADDTFRTFLDTLNVFHVWSAWVLATGLARLSAVSFKEAAFWVFGYWVVLRSALLLLA